MSANSALFNATNGTRALTKATWFRLRSKQEGGPQYVFLHQGETWYGDRSTGNNWHFFVENEDWLTNKATQPPCFTVAREDLNLENLEEVDLSGCPCTEASVAEVGKWIMENDPQSTALSGKQ